MGWLGSFFSKLWNAIRKVLAVILVIAAIVIAVWAVLITGGAALPLLFGLSSTMMYVVAGLCLVGAFIVDKKTATKVVGKVAEAVGDAAGAVGVIGGAVVGGVLGSILGNSYVLLAAGAFALYLLLKNKKGNERIDKAGVNVAEQKVPRNTGLPLVAGGEVVRSIGDDGIYA